MKTIEAGFLRIKMLNVADMLLDRIGESTPTDAALDLAHAVATLHDSATSPEYVVGSLGETVVGERTPLDPPPAPGKRGILDPPDPGKK